ncbi:hypothetical protein RN001_010347 [Aquatica leii]|uniref:GH18 domain-containing protein n=1 Tax=Aquatica leii TaxID=1421715 RepID=A0AAN7P9D4_9COLE|nr:hypothetical protein RN001_010347 [Aquatica leii]
MEDLSTSNKDTITSSISYTAFGINKKKCTFKEIFKNKTLLASAVALIILVPIYVLYRQTHIEVIYPIDNHYVLENSIQRAIYYNTVTSNPNPGYRLICYYTFPSPNESNSLMPEAIDPQLYDFVRSYKCDGVDLDWEFPNKVPSHDTKQRMHFTQLLYELRKEVNRQHQHKFIISVAVAAPKFIVDLSYDVPYINDYVDFVNVMTYDFHFYTKLTPFTGFNAPLYPIDTDFFDTFNTNFSINYWLELGMDQKKINVGLPTYGHTFELFNVNNDGLGAPARGYGRLGSNGFADYNEICLFLLDNRDIKVVFSYAARSPYACKGTEWVSFEDETSLLFKSQYINNRKFGGAMILSLNADDHSGRCKSQSEFKQFPLINRVKSILSNKFK